MKRCQVITVRMVIWRRRLAAMAPCRRFTRNRQRHEYRHRILHHQYLRKQKEDAGKKPIIAARKRVSNWRPKVFVVPVSRG